jgi:hypothetical protein
MPAVERIGLVPFHDDYPAKVGASKGIARSKSLIFFPPSSRFSSPRLALPSVRMALIRDE